MKNLFVGITMILVLAFIGCTGETITDVDLAATVKSKLAINPNTSAIKIGVDATNGVITLSGVVPTQREKDEAEQVAKGTAGVRGVVNNITINPDSIGATNIDKKTEEALRNTGAAITDAAILARIKAQFVANGIVQTNVDVNKGVVTLRGEVESNNERNKAEEIARKIEGVKNVKNLLTVKQS